MTQAAEDLTLEQEIADLKARLEGLVGRAREGTVPAAELEKLQADLGWAYRTKSEAQRARNHAYRKIGIVLGRDDTPKTAEEIDAYLSANGITITISKASTPSEPTKPTTPSTPQRGVYTTRPGAKLDHIQDVAEHLDATKGWEDILRLERGPIARAKNSRTMYDKNEPVDEFPVKHFRQIGDYCTKLGVYQKIYGLEEAAIKEAEIWLAILAQAKDRYTGKVLSKALLAIEDIGVLRFNYPPSKENPVGSVSFLYTDGSGLEKALTIGRIWSSRRRQEDNKHIPICAAACKAIDDYWEHFEKRIKAHAAKFAPGIPWTLYGSALSHPSKQLASGWLSAYQVTGREEFKTAWEHIAKGLQAEEFWGLTKDGIEIRVNPHVIHARQVDQNYSNLEPLPRAGVDLTYEQESNEAELHRYWIGDPYVTERHLAAKGNVLMLVSMPEGPKADTMAETISGSYKDESLKGKPVVVLNGTNEIVRIPGHKAARFTTRAHAVGFRRGAHYFGVPWTGRRAYLGPLAEIGQHEQGGTAFITRAMFRAGQRDPKVLGRQVMA